VQEPVRQRGPVGDDSGVVVEVAGQLAVDVGRDGRSLALFSTISTTDPAQRRLLLVRELDQRVGETAVLAEKLIAAICAKPGVSRGS
jgi:hypothetical protein